MEKTSTHDWDYQYTGSIQRLGKLSWSWFIWYFGSLKISDWDASYVHNVADFKLSITNACIIRIVPGFSWWKF